MGNMVKNGKGKFYEMERGGTRPQERVGREREGIGKIWKLEKNRKIGKIWKLDV